MGGGILNPEEIKMFIRSFFNALMKAQTISAAPLDYFYNLLWVNQTFEI
jgi:hypothetical protein